MATRIAGVGRRMQSEAGVLRFKSLQEFTRKTSCLDFEMRNAEDYIDKWKIELSRVASANPEGFTSVFKMPDVPVDNAGYIVGLSNTTLDYWLSLSPRALAHQRCAAKEVIKTYALPEDTIITIGGWLNPDNNAYMVDIGLQVKSRDKALEIAKEFGQIAIFGLAAMNTIPVS